MESSSVLVKDVVATTAQVFAGILAALWFDSFLQKLASTVQAPAWTASLLSALLAAIVVALVVNFVLARPVLTVRWSEFGDTEPLGKLDVQLTSNSVASQHFRVDVSVAARSAVARFIVWKLRNNGTKLRLTFPNAGVRPTVEDPLCDESGTPLCVARHEHVDFDLRLSTPPAPHWTNGTVTFSPRARVGDQTTNVHTQLCQPPGMSSRYARIVVIDATVRSIRVRET